MSIGFYLLGQFEKAQLDPDEVLRRLDRWIVTECFDLAPITRLGFLDEKPCLFCIFHPAGEEVEICLPDPEHVTVSANTSTVGPGYHIFLCDLFRRWTNKFAITWQVFDAQEDTTFGDETDYFFSRNKHRVYDEMEHWLRALCGSFFDGTLDGDAKDIALCIPMNVQFKGDGLAVTQLGPGDKDWLRHMSNGGISPREFFSWYEVGFTAEYHLGRALVQMWSDVRWRQPVNDKERRLLKSVVKSLETSYQLNPALDFPWNEWNELLGLLGESGSSRDFLKGRTFRSGDVGYRRNRVRTWLPGNWWIETDGSFSEFDSDEEGTLCSFDPPREIWFTAYSFSAEEPNKKFRQMREDVLKQKHEFTHEGEKYVSVADVKESIKNGVVYYLLKSSNIGILRRSVCTLVFERLEDREWALRVWKSLTPSKSKNGKS